MFSFRKYLKNEKRNYMLNTIKNIFDKIIPKNIKSYLFLVITVVLIYKMLTFPNKTPFVCGIIIDMIHTPETDKYYESFSMKIKTDNNIIEYSISKNVFLRYYPIFMESFNKNIEDKRLEYCDVGSDMNPKYIFIIVLVSISAFITFLFFFKAMIDSDI